jgi:hypothetical protein
MGIIRSRGLCSRSFYKPRHGYRAYRPLEFYKQDRAVSANRSPPAQFRTEYRYRLGSGL